MNRMNKKLYLGIYAASFAVFLVFGIISVLMLVFQHEISQSVGMRNAEKVFGIVFLFTAFAAIQFSVTYLVYTILILAKMWGAINDGFARTTPGTAIGLLFIPFFNIYWNFQVWSGFTKDYDAFVDRYKLPVAYLGSAAFSIYPLFIVLSAVPFLGIGFAVANLFVFYRII